MASAQFRGILKDQDQRWTKLRRDINRIGLAYLFILPGLILFIALVLMPVAQAFRYSLYDWDGFTPLSADYYVKLGNYERLYDHEVFQSAFKNTFLLMVLSLTIQLPLGMLLALMVGRGNLPGRRVFRALLFLPYVFSEIIAAIIWSYVLHPTDGLANLTFDTFIPGFEAQPWLGDPKLVIYAIFAVLTWKYFGFYMILYMAGLQGVPSDLEDAARVDGANWWRVIAYVTFPMMAPTIRLTVYLSVLGSFQQFVLVQFLTRGGNPVNAGHVLSTYLFKFGIQRFRLGYGSAVAIILFLITLLFSLGYQRYIMQRDFSVEDI
jgi:raffinose/stachyose/melibiose transport system permease protein